MSPARSVPAFSASRSIPAPPSVLWGILADYRHGHPRILPRPPFTFLEVEEGGVGAGTRIRVGMRLLGREQVFRAVVEEPEPGRVLSETNDDGYVTTFSVEPDQASGGSRVTIATTPPAGGGLRKALEARLVRGLLTPVYRRELELLAEAAGGSPTTSGHRG
jgi:hypothetical protein